VGANLSDQEIMEAPEMTITVGAQHIFKLSSGGWINLRADSYISDGYWADFETQPGTPVHVGSMHQAAYTTTNVNLTYHPPRDNWKLGLWARNLEDKAQIGPANAAGLGQVKGIGGHIRHSAYVRCPIHAEYSDGLAVNNAGDRAIPCSTVRCQAA
jgi:outer membrane receptor protein involved in Fe transport